MAWTINVIRGCIGKCWHGQTLYFYDDRLVIARQYQTQHKSVTSLSMHAVMTTSTLSVILRL